LSRDKNALRTTDLKPLRVPKIPEMAVGRMWPVASRNQAFLTYMPDNWSGDHKTDRTFFFQVWVKLELNLVETIIDDIRRQRLEAVKPNAQPNPIVNLDPEWAQLLLNAPVRPGKFKFLSSNKHLYLQLTR